MDSGQKSNSPTIKCSRNGPYIVRYLESVRNSRGEEIKAKSVMALCRCGGSANKPFCDGTHAKIGFSDERESDGSKDKWDVHVGKKITIHDNRGICSHAGFCAVFRVRREPGVDPDAADPEEIIKAVMRCPSGALSYSIDGVEYKDQDRAPLITVSRNGPYQIIGGIELADVPRSQGSSAEHYTLCRCGASKTKPFCDGTHAHIDFKDEKN